MLRTLLLSLHLVAVVLWIGGVGYVTTVVLPNAMSKEDSTAKAQAMMGSAEAFRGKALLYIAVVGATGVGNLAYFGLPPLESTIGLQIYLMIGIYVLLAGAVLLMPKLLSRFSKELSVDRMIKRVYLMHWLFLVLGLVAVADGAAIGHL